MEYLIDRSTDSATLAGLFVPSQDVLVESMPKRSLSASSNLSAFTPTSKRCCRRNTVLTGRALSVSPTHHVNLVSHSFKRPKSEDTVFTEVKKCAETIAPHGSFRPIEKAYGNDNVDQLNAASSPLVLLAKPTAVVLHLTDFSSVEFCEGAAPAAIKDRRGSGRRSVSGRSRTRSVGHRDTTETISPAAGIPRARDTSISWKDFCCGDGVDDELELMDIIGGCKSALSEAITDSEMTGSIGLTSSLSAVSSRASLGGISVLATENEGEDDESYDRFGLSASCHSQCTTTSSLFCPATCAAAQQAAEAPSREALLAKQARCTPLIEKFGNFSVSEAAYYVPISGANQNIGGDATEALAVVDSN